MPISSNRIHAMKPVARTAPRTTQGKSANASFVISESSFGGRLRLQPQFKSIGEVAAETGLTASAIRFYEKSGLVRAARSGGRRWWGPEDRARLGTVARARGTGFNPGGWPALAAANAA